MFTHSGDNVAATSGFTLPVRTGVGTPQEMVTTPEGPLVPATVLSSEAVDCTFADYKSKYADCFEVLRFNAMIFDGRNATMYDRRGAKRDIDIGGWNHRQSLMQSCCPGYLDPIDLLHMRLVRVRD